MDVFFFNFLKSENLSTQKPSSPVGSQNRWEPDHPLSPGSCQPTVTSPGPPSHPASHHPTTTVLFICGSSCCGHGDLSTSTFVTPKTQKTEVMLITSSSNSTPQGSRSFPFPNFLLQGERHHFFCAFFF